MNVDASSPAAVTLDAALAWLKANGIERIETTVPDMAGIGRGKVQPVSDFKEEGTRIPQAILAQTVNGTFHLVPENVGDRDMSLRADLSTLRRLPWTSEPTAVVIMDCVDDDGALLPISRPGRFSPDPRYVSSRGMVTGRCAGGGVLSDSGRRGSLEQDSQACSGRGRPRGPHRPVRHGSLSRACRVLLTARRNMSKAGHPGRSLVTRARTRAVRDQLRPRRSVEARGRRLSFQTHHPPRGRRARSAGHFSIKGP